MDPRDILDRSTRTHVKHKRMYTQIHTQVQPWTCVAAASGG
jgi:hypothetical protein